MTTQKPDLENLSMQTFEHLLNQHGTISLTCIHLGINDNNVPYFLSKKKWSITTRFHLIQNGTPPTVRSQKNISRPDLERALKKTQNLTTIAHQFGFSRLASFKTALSRRGYTLNKQFTVTPLKRWSR